MEQFPAPRIRRQNLIRQASSSTLGVRFATLFHMERITPMSGYRHMEHVTNVRGDGMQLAQSDRFRDGLRQAFAACHEPLPAEMEELLQRLLADDQSRAGH
jgi:hypothetical protein